MATSSQYGRYWRAVPLAGCVIPFHRRAFNIQPLLQIAYWLACYPLGL